MLMYHFSQNFNKFEFVYKIGVSYITLCIMMDFPIHIDTISMRLPFMYFKGSQVEFSKL